MIEYKADYTVGERPYICKKFVASNGEEVHTALSFANEKERLEMSHEVIFDHIRNLAKFIHDRSESMTIVEMDEDLNGEGWCIRGWTELSWAATDADLWWGYAYYKEEGHAARVPMSDEITPNYVDTPEEGSQSNA